MIMRKLFLVGGTTYVAMLETGREGKNYV